MGASMHVVGLKPPDEKWQKMCAVWDACKSAGVVQPMAVVAFFSGEDPDPSGVPVDETELRDSGALHNWEADMREGFEVDVTKLPADVTVLRFYISY